jgi:RimJ/RimL family protein N-acetyltransferase
VSVAGPDQPLPRPYPERILLSGRYVHLEPVDDAAHGDALHAASSVPDVADRFRFLFDHPPVDRADLARWIERSRATNDPMAFAVVDAATGRAGGRQALMRITPEHGVIEIGNIYWGPGIATCSTRSAIAATSGSATTATSRRSARPCASASGLRVCSASTW